jgi:hypothetical protein
MTLHSSFNAYSDTKKANQKKKKVKNLLKNINLPLSDIKLDHTYMQEYNKT